MDSFSYGICGPTMGPPSQTISDHIAERIISQVPKLISTMKSSHQVHSIGTSKESKGTGGPIRVGQFFRTPTTNGECARSTVLVAPMKLMFASEVSKDFNDDTNKSPSSIESLEAAEQSNLRPAGSLCSHSRSR